MPTRHQLLPFQAYFRETLAFLTSHSYLLSAELASLNDPDSDLGKCGIDFRARLPKTYGSPVHYFLARLFISQVASFEVLLQDTVALVLRQHPKKVGSSTFSLAEIVDAGDHAALVDRAIDECLNKLMYKKPMDYLDDLCNLLSIEDDPLRECWKVFVEAKARRDLGVHASWRCNDVYLRKLKEAMIASSAKVGDLMLPLQEGYLDATMDSLNELAMEITKRVAAVHWPDVDMNDLDVLSDA